MFHRTIKKKVPLKEKRQIFTAKDVHNLIIKKDKIIGKGLTGRIYEGTIIFKDKSGKHIKKKVAIKEFIDNINPDEIKKYKKVIKDLRSIKLELDHNFPNRNLETARLIPKMDMIQTKDGKWVLVMQSFVKNGKSKFYENNHFNISKFSELQLNEFVSECAYILIKIAEKGYDTFDILAQFKDKKSVLPLDIDIPAFGSKTSSPIVKKIRLMESIESLNSDLTISNDPSNPILNKICYYSLNYISDRKLKKLFIEEIKKKGLIK